MEHQQIILTDRQRFTLTKVIAHLNVLVNDEFNDEWIWEVEDLAQILAMASPFAPRDAVEERTFSELRAEVEELRSTQLILVSGLGPGIKNWMKCALRLRAELKRVDPGNRTEAHIDWRLEPELPGIQ